MFHYIYSFIMWRRTVPLNLAETLGKNTQKYIQERETKIRSFAPRVHQEITEILRNFSVNNPQTTLLIGVSSLLSKEGKLWKEFVGKSLEVREMTLEEVSLITTEVQKMLQEEDKLHAELMNFYDRVNLNIAWDLPSVVVSPTVAPPAIIALPTAVAPPEEVPLLEKTDK